MFTCKEEYRRLTDIRLMNVQKNTKADFNLIQEINISLQPPNEEIKETFSQPQLSKEQMDNIYNEIFNH